MKNEWILLVKAGLCFAGLLGFVGCATTPPVQPARTVFTDLPVYENTRTNWTGSTGYMLYPMYGAEDDAVVTALNAELNRVLMGNGYHGVQMETFMGREKRMLAEKIVQPVFYKLRRHKKNRTEEVCDMLTIFSVADRLDNDMDFEKGNSSPRFFQVWGRCLQGDVPYDAVAEALLRVDGFREALEPSP